MFYDGVDSGGKGTIMEIFIKESAQDVAKLAADIMGAYANAGKTLGVATGSTPLSTYQELIRRYKAGEVTFKNTRMFALDEYVGLPFENEQSYHHVIHSELADQVDVAPENVHIPNGMAEDIAAACAEYEQAIKDSGGIDIQLLGIGTDGHIGFNEPSSSLASATRLKTLHPQTVKDNARFFDSPEEVPYHVITQGLGTIRRAGHLLMLATGENKAQAVHLACEGAVSSLVPASILQLHPHATVIVDRPAASKLLNTEYYEFTAAHKPDWQRKVYR